MASSHLSLYESFLELRAAAIRAIGRSWNDADFKRELLEEEQDATPLLEECAYTSQLAFRLRFQIPPTFRDTHRFDPLLTGGWIGANNVVRLYIPPRPEKREDWPEALAAFHQENLLFLRSSDDARDSTQPPQPPHHPSADRK